MHFKYTQNSEMNTKLDGWGRGLGRRHIVIDMLKLRKLGMFLHRCVLDKLSICISKSVCRLAETLYTGGDYFFTTANGHETEAKPLDFPSEILYMTKRIIILP